MNNIIYRVPIRKTTVREEFEYWNILFIFQRLNDYFRYKLRYKVNKDLQGLESHDFTMQVIEKVISGSYSWERSSRSSFIDFIYDVASSEINHFGRDNKTKHFISYDLLHDKGKELQLADHYNGF
jgi:hypothetical protein